MYWYNSFTHENEWLICEHCGDPNHITGLGQCSKWGKWWPQCNYCQKKDVDVRENGAYYGCRKCVGEYTYILMSLPTDKAARKDIPIGTGVLDYFPLALAEVAKVSRIGNEQHHPGKPLHWDKTKSTDEADALIRHFLERGTVDTDGGRHSAKMAWRALALLEREIETEAKPVKGEVFRQINI